MKRIYLLALAITLSTQAMHQDDQDISICGHSVATLCYTVGKYLGRNDYHYLASANSTWFLKQKLEREENYDDRDKYYPRYQRSNIFNGVTSGTILCVTPLIEAINMGSIGCVKLLLKHGADKNKKVLCGNPISWNILADESRSLPCLCRTSHNEQEAADAELADFKSMCMMV